MRQAEHAAERCRAPPATFTEARLEALMKRTSHLYIKGDGRIDRLPETELPENELWWLLAAIFAVGFISGIVAGVLAMVEL